MLSSYRRVLSVPGTLAFSATGFVARLPISMVGLGIVLMISGQLGSYTLAGTVAAAYVMANALFAILHGRLLDRLGQSRVLPTTQVLVALSMVLLVWAVQDDWPVWSLHLFAATTGASLPQVGSAVRARWAHALSEPRQVQTAYALEAVVDEAVFLVGPVLATLLATTWHPSAGLVAAGLFGVTGTLYLSTQRRTEPPRYPRRHRATHGHRRMPWRMVLPMVALCLALGVIFGAVEVTTVAFAEERGAKAWAGVVLGIWALGSLVAGVVTGAVHWRRSADARMRLGMTAMAVAMLPLLLVDTMVGLASLLLLGGLAISPTLIATMSLANEVLPRARLTEGMALLHTGMAAGVAPGAAISGLLIDQGGATAAFVVPVVAGAVGVVAGLLTPRPATVTP
ncbi:MFS transporter [Nocardioides limicola]|uniref:MFS transporter n=1 Tax=Nocardioides limicola TaxID=2803368 RepID=UPI00193B605C|nr:MFS transporter [Nocardioides sp. DJM-14]